MPVHGYELSPDCGKYNDSGEGIVKGSIESTNYPHEYPPNLECIYIFEAKEGENVALTFDSFELEYSENCKYDSVEIRDGRWGFSPFIGRYCGNSAPTRVITSTGRYIWLRFFTDEIIQSLGFKIFYEFLPGSNENTSNDCVFEKKALDGIIGSSEVYGPGEAQLTKALDCTWELSSPDYSKIMITFNKFQLHYANNCNKNEITLYDRVSSDNGLTKRFCSTAAPPIMTQSNRAFLRFRTIDNKSAFAAIFTAYEDPPCNQTLSSDHFQCSQDMCIDKSLACNGRKNCINYAWDEELCDIIPDSPLIKESQIIIFGCLGGFILILFALAVYLSRRKSRRPKASSFSDNSYSHQENEPSAVDQKFLSAAPDTAGFQSQYWNLSSQSSASPMKMIRQLDKSPSGPNASAFGEGLKVNLPSPSAASQESIFELPDGSPFNTTYMPSSDPPCIAMPTFSEPDVIRFNYSTPRSSIAESQDNRSQERDCLPLRPLSGKHLSQPRNQLYVGQRLASPNELIPTQKCNNNKLVTS